MCKHVFMFPLCPPTPLPPISCLSLLNIRNMKTKQKKKNTKTRKTYKMITSNYYHVIYSHMVNMYISYGGIYICVYPTIHVSWMASSKNYDNNDI